MKNPFLALALFVLTSIAACGAEPSGPSGPDAGVERPAGALYRPVKGYTTQTTFEEELEALEAEQAQLAAPVEGATLTSHSAVNGFVNLPSAADQYCLLQRSLVRGGAANSALYENTTIPMKGAQIEARPNVGVALISVPSNANGTTKTATMTADCRSHSDFEWNAGAGGSSDWENLYLLWPAPLNFIFGGFVYGDVPLWHWSNDAFCFLDNLDGLSVPNEMMQIYQHGDGRWHLYGQGYARLRGDAKCLWAGSGKVVDLEGPFAANKDQTAWGISTWRSICGFTMVEGQVDDALLWIREQQATWTLSVTSPKPGAHIYAQMWCARFPP